MKYSRHQIKMIQAMDEINTYSAQEADEIGYIPRFLANVSLPVSNIYGNEYTRINGKYGITLLSPSPIGLPYGTYPRMLLVHITTIAKIERSREIYLGNSGASFMHAMGLQSSGGKNGSLSRLKDQSKRLFATSFQMWVQEDDQWKTQHVNVAEQASLLWDPIRPKAWESTLTLGSLFWKDIDNHAVPIDKRVLRALSHYPAAFDVYCWLTYRYFSLRRKLLVPWSKLKEQFGYGIANENDFKKTLRKALRRVSFLYPEANFECSGNGLILMPSRPHVQIRGVRVDTSRDKL